jgi:hypothetical protein
MNTIRPRLTYANIVATLALFLAIAGGAAIAATAKKNSVTTKSIKNGNVTAPDLAGIHVVTSPLGGSNVPTSAACPAGEKLIGGGVKPVTIGFTQFGGSYPSGNSWIAQTDGNSETIALCLRASTSP